MHVGLHTTVFGNIEVHTIIHDRQVDLAVGSEKGDLRTLLSSEVPGLQTTLRQQDLRLDSVHFLESSCGPNAGLSSGTHSQSRSFHEGQTNTGTIFSSPVALTAARELDSDSVRHDGLNVHA